MIVVAIVTGLAVIAAAIAAATGAFLLAIIISGSALATGAVLLAAGWLIERGPRGPPGPTSHPLDPEAERYADTFERVLASAIGVLPAV
jgi:hypothetical protein